MKSSFFPIGAIVLAGLLILASCPQPTNDGGNQPVIDTSVLQATITEAETLLDDTGVSESGDGSEFSLTNKWVTLVVFDAYKIAINAAKAALDAKTQEVVDAAVSALQTARVLFEALRQDGTKSTLFSIADLEELIDLAGAVKSSVAISTNGADIDPDNFWVTQEDVNAISDAITAAENASKTNQSEIDAAYNALKTALDYFKNAMRYGQDATIIEGDSLAEKLAAIKAEVEDGKTYEIVLNKDEVLDGLPAHSSRFIHNFLEYDGKTVKIILKGDSSMRTVNLTSNGSLFIIAEGVTLELGNNIRLRGRSDNNRPLVIVGTDEGAGTLKMSGNAEITGNTNTADSGGAVGIWNDGSFIMSGGTITGNSAIDNGGGVAMWSGTFTMSSGSISNNASNGHAGGGVYVSGSTFTMTGGTISGNTSFEIAGGVSVWEEGFFKMSGGSINGNTALNDAGGGIQVSCNAAFVMEGNAKIYSNKARGTGGVSIKPDSYDMDNNVPIPGGSFHMKGNAEIYDNTSAEWGGGGVGVGGTFTMEGDAKIYNNKAKNAAGVAVWGEGVNDHTGTKYSGGKFLMQGKAEIHNNIATEWGGGGVGVDHGAEFTMDGYAKIYNNKASDHAGVDISKEGFDDKNSMPLPGGIFNMKGNAEIYGNIAQWVSGGVGSGGTFNMEGNARIHNNSAELGGGVFIYNGGIFTMMGSASIDNNKAKEKAGVEIHGEWYDDKNNLIPGGVFTMKGNAEVHHNITINDCGGVGIGHGAEFTMQGNAKIHNNIADNFGGVQITSEWYDDNNRPLDSGTFIMEGNAEIYGNIAKSYAGGVGVGHGAEFIMQGNAKIHNNKANEYCGVQVYGEWYDDNLRLLAGGTFTIKGNAEIYGNIAQWCGGGVGSGGIFNMEGNTRIHNNSAEWGGGVRIFDNGTFNMTENASIDNNRATEKAGIEISGEWYDVKNNLMPGGTFTMKGNAAVHHNTATDYIGGVCVGHGAEFIMQGNAKIHNNIAKNSAGVAVHSEGYNDEHNKIYSCGTFKMKENAEIYENTSTEKFGGGVEVGGVFIMQGDARIYRNKAVDAGGVIVNPDWYDDSRGVIVPRGEFTMEGNAKIYENIATLRNGGGVNSGGIFTMRGDAKIYKNEAKECGGGVQIHDHSSSIFTMSGNAVIYENKAETAGGVFVSHDEGTGSFTMSGNATIADNTASRSVGGVLVANWSGGISSFTMTGGTIKGNKARFDAGGVHVALSNFIMTGGTITENIVEESGSGGVLVQGSNFTMSGDAKISYNENTTGAWSGGVTVISGPDNVGSVFTMEGGTIEYNETHFGEGGGVLVRGPYSTFNLNSPALLTSISGNNSASPGKQIYVNSSGIFKIDGASQTVPFIHD